MYITTKFNKNKIKYKPFKQTKNCKKAFQDLKQAFMTILVLAHFNPKLKTQIKSDFSNFVTVSIFSQMHKRVLRSIVQFSKKLTLAEYNYTIYSKNLLVIVQSFLTWHLKLASIAKLLKIYTNYRNLEYFMTTKQLNK